MEGNRTSAETFIWLRYKQNFVINLFVIGEVYCICQIMNLTLFKLPSNMYAISISKDKSIFLEAIYN